MGDRAPTLGGGAGLRGRASESAALDGLLRAIRRGESRSLVVRGEAGIGKTALLDDMCERADGLLVVRGGGIECEAELAFAGLHHMCSQMIEEKLELLPDPQREAIRRAFGESADGPPDPFLLGLGVLSRLADMAEEQPVVCVVDDAQWLDRASAQTLAFVARRLDAEAVGVVFAVRERIEQLDGLPELVVSGLGPDDADQLLCSVLTAPLDHAVRERFIDETRGNPLALLELPRGLDAAELAGGFGIRDALGVPTRVEESFQRRCEELPDETRLLMLIAAAEPVGDPVLLWRAATTLGVASAAVEPAEAAGLLKLGTRVLFRHPLVRSAVYRMATHDERRRVHRALATATDPDVDPDRRAWHAAHGASGPDEDIAAALERSAGRAQARGGLAAATAFLARAVELSPEADARGRRALAASEASLRAGMFDEARGMLSAAEVHSLGEFERVRLDLLRAEAAYSENRGSDAPPLLLRAARALEPLDLKLARETYLDAWSAAGFAGRFARAVLEDVCKAARAAPRLPGPPRPPDLLLDGLVLLFTDGRSAAVPLLEQAAAAFAGDEVSREEMLRWGWLATDAAVWVWDYETCMAIATKEVELGRRAGALAMMGIGVNVLAAAAAFGGDFNAASLLVAEANAVNEATGSQVAPYGALVLTALKGREHEAAELIANTIKAATTGGQGTAVQYARWAQSVLFNALGRYDEALVAAEDASNETPEMFVSAWALSELIEASVRRGKADLARTALERLTGHTRDTDQAWAHGIEARARALACKGDAAERLYREAIERLARTRLRPELARGHLLYGEWLRRENRRVDARAQLRFAHDQFTSIGMEAFAERARKELLATGEKPRKRTVETRDDLTAQERQIADLARSGLANPEIGARLFLSPRTVEWHLHKVFGKLGIRSRHELANALARPEPELKKGRPHAPEFASTTRPPR